MKPNDTNTADPPPRPGTPQYNECIASQGQRAMDRALAMPLVRVFFGLLALCFAGLCVAILIEPIEGGRWWGFCFRLVFVLLVGLPLLVDIGSVALFGRSRTPWFRAIMRRWKPGT